MYINNKISNHFNPCPQLVSTVLCIYIIIYGHFCGTVLHHAKEWTETSADLRIATLVFHSLHFDDSARSDEWCWGGLWSQLKGSQRPGKLLGCAQPQYSQYFSVCRPRRGIDTLLLLRLSRSQDSRLPQGAQPPLALRRSMLSCLEEKGEAITGPKPGTCQSGSPQMNENVPAVTPYCRIDLCVFRHTFSTGRGSLPGSVRWDALLVETQGLRGALQWPLLQIKSLLFQHPALPSRQIADLGCVPLCVCVWWCVGALSLFLSFSLFSPLCGLYMP